MSSRAALKQAVADAWNSNTQKPKGTMLYVTTGEASRLKVQDLDTYFDKHPNPQKMPTLDTTKKGKKKGFNFSEEEMSMIQRTLKDQFSRSVYTIPVDEKKCNTLFSSLLEMITDIPKDYQPRHMRRNGVMYLLEGLEDNLPLLKPDLDRIGYSLKAYCEGLLSEVTHPTDVTVRLLRFLLKVRQLYYFYTYVRVREEIA